MIKKGKAEQVVEVFFERMGAVYIPKSLLKRRALYVSIDELLKYTYVRQMRLVDSRRGYNPNKDYFGDQHKIIGFATIGHEANGLFDTLIWWLKTYDVDGPEPKYGKESNNRPSEAVSPESVAMFFASANDAEVRR